MLRSCLFAAALVALPLAAEAGCLTGAVVGGVVGHVAGHHGLLGAGAGCVAGHEMSKDSAEKAQQSQQPPQNGTTPTSGQAQGQ